MFTLHLMKNFNNYYNRRLVKRETLDDYINDTEHYIMGYDTNNFELKDGINTSVVINYRQEQDTPDYVLVENNGNFTRWYVISSDKTRGGQFKLNLKRDSLADFYTDVTNYSPCVIEKGYVDNKNPLVFANEGQQYNQIKKDEILLKDKSNSSWIVGFISEDSPGGSVEGTVKAGKNYDYAYSSIYEFPYYLYTNLTQLPRLTSTEITSPVYISFKSSTVSVNKQGTYISPIDFEVVFDSIDGTLKNPSWYTAGNITPIDPTQSVIIKESGSFAWTTNEYADESRNYPYGMYIKSYPNGADDEETVKRVLYNHRNTLAKTFSEKFPRNTLLSKFESNADKYNALKTYNNKVFKIGTGTDVKYYRCKVVSHTTNRIVSLTESELNDMNYYPSNSELYSYALGWLSEPRCMYGFDPHYSTPYKPNGNAVKALAITDSVYLQLELEDQDVIHTTIPAPADRTHLIDAPYDMFVLPYEGLDSYKLNWIPYTVNPYRNMDIAKSIGAKLSASNFDIQIVPYCPIPGLITSTNTIDISNYVNTPVYDGSNKAIAHVIWANTSNITFTLDNYPIQPEDYKKDSNLNVYRLCSPGGSNIYEFSPSMNGGINTWNVSCTFKPYGSYIKVQPNFGNLYGQSTFNNKTDLKGLIYTSSTSISQLTDAWADFERTNKNYQNIFDTQIQTERKTNQLTYDYQMYYRHPNTLTQGLSTINPFGWARAITGNVINEQDTEMNYHLTNLALDSKENVFDYQIDNIKATPSTLKGVTSLTVDNKLYPYVEIYGCTEAEEEIFNNKIKYTGMTIMATGFIKDYLKPNDETFIKASLIRLNLDTSNEYSDFDLAQDIAFELNKGIFITKEA